MAEYIEREKLYDFLTEQLDKETGMYSKGRNNGINIARSALHNREQTPAADVVSRCVLDQIRWERDVAIEQLREDYGVGLGEKKPADVVRAVRCDNCRHMKLLDGVLRFCKIWNAPNGMGADGFCSYGERKDGDG